MFIIGADFSPFLYQACHPHALVDTAFALHLHIRLPTLQLCIRFPRGFGCFLAIAPARRTAEKLSNRGNSCSWPVRAAVLLSLARRTTRSPPGSQQSRTATTNGSYDEPATACSHRDPLGQQNKASRVLFSPAPHHLLACEVRFDLVLSIGPPIRMRTSQTPASASIPYPALPHCISRTAPSRALHFLSRQGAWIVAVVQRYRCCRINFETQHFANILWYSLGEHQWY